MKFLLIEDEDEIRELIRFNIELEPGTHVYEARNGTDAVELLQKLKDVDVIICDYQMPGMNGGQVQKYVVNQNLPCKFVLSSAYDVETLPDVNPNKLYLAIKKPDISEGLTILFDMLKKDNIGDRDTIAEPAAYHTVAVSLIYKTGVCPCDLYLELNKDKILKILNQGEMFSDEDYVKYTGKKLTKFLIKNEDGAHCSKTIERNISVLFKNLTDEEVEKAVDVQDYIHDTVKRFGLNDDVINIAKEGVDYAVSIIRNNKNLKKLLKNIFTNQRDFIPQHSVALAFISCAVASKMQWNSEPTMVKLAFASLIHDVFIDSPKLNETEEVQKSEKNKDFMNHTIECSTTLSKNPDVPPDVDKIILEHHEQPDGSGFPKGIDHMKISPLSSLFIISHQIVEIAMDLKMKGEMLTDEKVKARINKEKYQKGNFKKVFSSIDDLKLFGE
ncbi:MAG: response regulator [Bacteriovoracaceae bacterium]|nr:response regulator [Bacteriovoracaceae bacterium]